MQTTQPPLPDVQALFQAAIKHHQAGHLPEAERLYRRILAIAPRHADSLHLLGVVAAQSGNNALAAGLIGQAIALAPERPSFHANLANVLQDLGRQEEALASRRTVLALTPGSSEAHKKLGDALQRLGQFDAAAESYRRALDLRPDDADAQISLGNMLYEQNRMDAAEGCYRAALALRPNDPDAHNNIGSVLYRLGRLDDAEAWCRKALALDPQCAAAHANLADVLREQGRLDDAVASYHRAIALQPDRAETHNNLGVACLHLGHAAEASDCFRTAIRLRPDYAEALNNASVTHTRDRQLDEAIACCRTALRQQADYPEAHHNLALALLLTGDMAAGWAEYEWRWQVEPGLRSRPAFTQPQWQGEPAAGRTLLVLAEQGLGDTLQFCRYVSLAYDRGLRVIVAAPSPLLRLLRGLRGVAGLVAPGEAFPPFDLYCPMMSLPLALGTTLATVPGNTPYLHADAAQQAAWRARLAPNDGAGPRVGLVWAGNPRPDWPMAAAIDRRRSLPPERLAPLFDIEGIQFFSLQQGGSPAPAGFPLIDHMAEMQDFADTAALVANLDLVVSVDTAVAHLAGALGRPVCLLDRFDNCWRWLTGRRDSPWYPTLRIYREKQPGDWDTVLTELVSDLRDLAAAWQTAWAARQGTPADGAGAT